MEKWATNYLNYGKTGWGKCRSTYPWWPLVRSNKVSVSCSGKLDWDKQDDRSLVESYCISSVNRNIFIVYRKNLTFYLWKISNNVLWSDLDVNRMAGTIFLPAKPVSRAASAAPSWAISRPWERPQRHPGNTRIVHNPVYRLLGSKPDTIETRFDK